MTKDEALKLALEALETNNKAWKHLADSGDAGFWEAEEQPFYELSIKAITAIKEALAQPEPEYLAFMDIPQRTWVGLTPQERDEINEQVYGAVPHHVAFHAAIEAKLRSKNT